jgi:hypothetical protein
MDLSFERWRWDVLAGVHGLVSNEILLEMLAVRLNPDQLQMIMILIKKVNVE